MTRRIESFPSEIPRTFEEALREGYIEVPTERPRKLRRTLYRYRDALVMADSPLALRYASLAMRVGEGKLILETKK